MNDLTGRVAIVTGAAQGLGAAYARALAAAGARLSVCDLNDPQAVVDAIAAAGGEAIGTRADVSSPSLVAATVAATVQAYGRIDVLVNNAGMMSSLPRRPFEQIPSDEWDRVMTVNARGTFEFSKAVVPHMRARKYGKIITIASGTPFKGATGMMQYVASKGAVVAMTRVMARELGADNICVNCIAPGLTSSDGVLGNAEHAVGIPRTAATRCLQRPETPEDLVGAVVFFASAASDFITGQTLLVDGGAVLH